MIDRVVSANERPLMEVPVGFKWFAQGLAEQSIAFAGEESAGATLLDRKGNTWTTDKDGIVMALLAAEILAKTGKNPGQYYDELCQQHGTSYYRRVDTVSSADKNARFKGIRAYKMKLPELAGDSVSDISTKASGNGAQFGGIKVTTDNGWFAARPSGTEPVYKIYAESFVSEQHLDDILTQATTWVNDLLTD
jgi:phosphoglucomutase